MTLDSSLPDGFSLVTNGDASLALRHCRYCEMPPKFEMRSDPDRIHIWCNNPECLLSVHLNWAQGHPVELALDAWNGIDSSAAYEAGKAASLEGE